MNLPLQMCAVSRGRLPNSRIASSVGHVIPSWNFECDQVACSCTNNGVTTVACCDNETQCSCTPDAGCSGRPGHGNGHPHKKGAKGSGTATTAKFYCLADNGTPNGTTEVCN
jgi:hypothetical protein